MEEAITPAAEAAAEHATDIVATVQFPAATKIATAVAVAATSTLAYQFARRKLAERRENKLHLVPNDEG